MGFLPEEILFLPSAACNLRCQHCITPQTKKTLSPESAIKFIDDCRKMAIEKISFTGGEPFLAADFLNRVIRRAANFNMTFGRVMTNAVWFNNAPHLAKVLTRLYDSGYDGNFCVSSDAFHDQDLDKVALFIKTAAQIWQRKDMTSIAYVLGGQDCRTHKKLKSIAKRLSAKLSGFAKSHGLIKSEKILIRLIKIQLSPIGKARHLKDPWAGKWFQEDFCKGPGNVFLVMPNGDVKPCCGYASDLDILTIGNIHRDSVKTLLRNVRKNKFTYNVFFRGLSCIRNRLIAKGIKFTGKTADHCYFCWYINTKINPDILRSCLT